MTARDEILARVRGALPERNPDQRLVEYEAIGREYHVGSGRSREETVELFRDRLKDYNAIVHRCAAGAVAECITAVLTARKKSGLLTPDGIDATWLPATHSFPRDGGLTYADMDSSEGVLTGCAIAIAMTGTIVVRHSPQLGRRALTLVPDYHLCVVEESQIVETVPEGIRRMSSLLPAPLTTISGPSATSDIEMIRVKGVHGPRTLEVILAGN